MAFLCAADLSLSNTGISVFTDDGEYVESISIDTKSEKEHSGKLKLIGNRLLELRKKYNFSHIAIEQGFTRFNISTQALYKVHGLTQYLFYDIGQTYLAATTIKKEITGRGNAKKEELRDTILGLYPNIKFNDLDQSDSFCIGITYLRRKGVI